MMMIDDDGNKKLKQNLFYHPSKLSRTYYIKLLRNGYSFYQLHEYCSTKQQIPSCSNFRILQWLKIFMSFFNCNNIADIITLLQTFSYERGSRALKFELI